MSFKKKLLLDLEKSNLLTEELKLHLLQENNVSIKDINSKIRKLTPKLRTKNLSYENLSILENSIVNLKAEKNRLKPAPSDTLEGLIKFYYKNVYDVDIILNECFQDVSFDSITHEFVESFKITNRLTEYKKFIKIHQVLNPLLRSKKISDSLKLELKEYLTHSKKVSDALKLGFKESKTYDKQIKISL